MIDSNTLQQLKDALTAYQEDQETLQPIVTLAKDALGDNWENELTGALSEALAGESNKDALLEKAEHAVHYYGALVAWDEATGYLSGKVSYTDELLIERMPVLEYWLNLFGEEGTKLVAQVKELISKDNANAVSVPKTDSPDDEGGGPVNTSLDENSSIQEVDDFSEKKQDELNTPILDEKNNLEGLQNETPQVSVIQDAVQELASEVSSSEPKIEEIKVPEENDVVSEPVVGKPKIEEENTVSNVQVDEIKDEELGGPENDAVLDATVTSEPIKEETVISDIRVEEKQNEEKSVPAGDSVNVNPDNITGPKQEENIISEPVSEIKNENINNPVEDNTNLGSNVVSEQIQEENVLSPKQEDDVLTEIQQSIQDNVTNPQSDPVVTSEVKDTTVVSEVKEEVVVSDVNEIPNLDNLDSNTTVPNEAQNTATDSEGTMSIEDRELSELEQLRSVDPTVPGIAGITELKEEKIPDVSSLPERAPDIEDKNPTEETGTVITSRNWDVAAFLRQKKLFEDVNNWLSAWCIHMDNADKTSYPYYGFIADLIYDLKEKAHNILDNQLLDEIIEQDVPGGREAVKRVAEAVDQEIEGFPDDYKQSTAEKIKLSAREILGKIDTSEEEEDIGAPPDGFELMDDPYAVSTDKIISDFEKTEQEVQNKIDKLDVMDKNT